MLLCALTLSVGAMAQEDTKLRIEVEPVQPILPPQIGDYKSNPGNFFTVRLINTTSQEQQCYIALQIEQMYDNKNLPANLSVSSPPSRMPNAPFVVPAGGELTLTMEQMRRIFDHIPLSEMQFNTGLLGNAGSSDYALLPEGEYRARLTAYKWDALLLNTNGLVDDPVALSNADITGFCTFRVCYKAQAPVFLTPNPQMASTQLYDYKPALLSLMNPTFTWTEPVMNCAREFEPMYQYTLTVYEMLQESAIKQTPYDAVKNGHVFRVTGLFEPQCMLDYSAIKKLIEGHLYVAQVEAKPIGATGMNYSMVENDGKSPFLIFTPDLSDDGDYDDDREDDDEEEEEDVNLAMLGVQTEIGEDDIYVFQNPVIVKPDFKDNLHRALFAGNTLEAEWKRPLHAGGQGEKPDTLQFRYKVQLYNISGYATTELALEQAPLYEGYAKGKMPEISSVGKGDDKKSSDKSGGQTAKKDDYKNTERLNQMLGELQELLRLRAKLTGVASVLGSKNKGDDTAGQLKGGLASEAALSGETESAKLSQVERDRLKKLNEKYAQMGIVTDQQVMDAIDDLKKQLGEGKDSQSASATDPSKEGVDVLQDYIPWSAISDKVSVGQTLMLRIVPETTGNDSVRFFGDVNELYFQYSDKLSEAFGDACGDGMIGENRVPGKFSNKEMRGNTVFVGEYELTMGDDVEFDSKTQSWSGTGFMLWQPFGQKVKVGVKFDKIFINSDRIMYEGVVTTETKSNRKHIEERAKAYAKNYTDTSELGDWIPDDIFTEWGLDNLVGYALPEELNNTLEGQVAGVLATNAAREQANSLAKSVKASALYDYIRKGYAVYDNFQKNGVGGMPDIEVFLPLQISDVKKTPVDIQILSMEFHPTFAWMNLMGVFALPDNDVTEDEILIFGAPRTCMDPDRVLPGSGIIFLMDEVTLNDPNSAFDFTFKQPADFKEPKDGCYVKWDNDTLSALSLHVEMTVPGLIKCDDAGGIVQGEHPKLTAKSWISDWNNWYASVSMEPFTHEDIKGWVFEAEDVTYDHSATTNPDGIKFLVDKGYDKEQAGMEAGNDNSWQGLYVKKLKLRFPKGFISSAGAVITAENMLIDPSGISMALNYDHAIDGEWGGWAMHLDKIFINIIQSNFKDCGFNGTMKVPLMKEQMAFTCDMYPMEREDGSSDFDFILKVVDESQLNNISFDFFLAKLELNREQTYFLLESRAGRQADGERETRAELCLGGDISIGGIENLNAVLSELGEQLALDLRIPGIHFTQMRLANCKRWLADADLVGGKDIRQLQENATKSSKDNQDKKLTWKTLSDQHTYMLGDSFVFETGIWSVASVEKRIGPFKFGITNYELTANPTEQTMGLNITGRMSLMDKGSGYDNDIDKHSLISVAMTVGIDCDVDVKNRDFKFRRVHFDDIALNANFCGVTLEGGLSVGNTSAAGGTSKGYGGHLKIALPGDLLSFEADGGFYEHSDGYKWGFFYLGAGGKMGIQITPLKITKLGAGLYFNCYSATDDKTKVTPEKGMIGVMADMGLATSDGELLSGDFHMSVLYDKDANEGKGRLTTFLFTGDCKAVSGIIDTKITIHYQNDATDKYFQLTATVDATADGSKIVNALGEKVGAAQIADQMKKLNSKWEAAKGAVTGTLEGAMKPTNTNVPDEPTKANMKDVDAAKASAPKMGATASLDFKITFRENGVNLPQAKWHVYLGEPDEKKRCAFTLIKFKSPIVSVDIGANFYFCIGNELPNNGELPPIPPKIQQFLNGGSVGGVEGATLTKANNARKKALKMFSSDAGINGGVMLGAAWYGSIDFNLGIFYGDMGAIAGFDATMAKLKDPTCPGYGQMGYKGWYAEGQIYAYLYAKFGIHVNLGFWDKKFDIVDAGIGGVLKAGLPHPSYFVGDARIKLKLLGGLVKINRRFQFECGHVCNIFYGNPLDNFELFGDCTIGSAQVKEGWAKDAEKVSPYLKQRPVYYTQAQIGEHFRVLDENTLHQLEEKYEGDVSDLEMQSKRTFIFRHSQVKPYMLEFSVMPDTASFSMDSDGLKRLLEAKRDRMIELDRKELTQTSFRFDNLISQLRPNKYYCIVVDGNAKEIIKGKEEDPYEYDKNKNKWVYRPWNQVQIYFFKTGDGEAEVEDAADLEPFVALAYPSNEGEIRVNLEKDDFTDEREMMQACETVGDFKPVYLEDVRHPVIALDRKIFEFYSSGRQLTRPGYPYQNGTLYWMWSQPVRQETAVRPSSGTNVTRPKSGTTETRTTSTATVSARRSASATVANTASQATSATIYTASKAYKVSTQSIQTSGLLSGAVRESSTLRTYDVSTGGSSSDNSRIKDLGPLSPGNENADVYDPTKKHGGATMEWESGTGGVNGTSGGGGAQSGNHYYTTGDGADTSGDSYYRKQKAVIVNPVSNNYQSIISGGDLLSGLESQAGQNRTLALVYEYTRKDTVQSMKQVGYKTETDLDGNKITVPNYKATTEVKDVTHYKVLMALNVRPVERTWKTGYATSARNQSSRRDSYQASQLAYSKPFVGMSLIDYSLDESVRDWTDNVWVNNETDRLADPFAYLSYLANYVFIGGHPLYDYDFTTMGDSKKQYAPMAESLIFFNKAGRTSGNFDLKTSYNISEGRKKLKDMTFFMANHAADAFGSNPLPDYPDLSWTPPYFSPSKRTPFFMPGSDQATWVRNGLQDIASIYYIAQAVSRMPEYHKAIKKNGLSPSTSNSVSAFVFDMTAWKGMWNIWNTGTGVFFVANPKAADNMKSDMQSFHLFRTGLYKTVSYSWRNGTSRDTISVQIPYYQFPLIYGACFKHAYPTTDFTLYKSMSSLSSNDRKYDALSNKLFFRFVGGSTITPVSGGNYRISYSDSATGVDNSSVKRERFDALKALQKVKKVTYQVYRVDAYNYETGQYFYSGAQGEANAMETVVLDKPFSKWTDEGSYDSASQIINNELYK